MRKHVLTTFVAITLLAVGTVYAQRPKVNVGRKHPNLEAAQKLTQSAWEQLVVAQKAANK